MRLVRFDTDGSINEIFVNPERVTKLAGIGTPGYVRVSLSGSGDAIVKGSVHEVAQKLSEGRIS